MNDKRLKRSLRRIVGSNAFLDDPAGRAAYSYDSSLQTVRPGFVLFPRTTDQVAEVVTLLYGEGIPYVARGAGTNLSGGSIALAGGAVIVLTRMKRILSIEPENFCVRVEPGLTNLALQEALFDRGFFFAPDPASQKVSTLGGNVAENSGGPRCLKYGVTTNHILGLTIVTPEGEIVELGGKALDNSGYDLLGLFVGSEGTLGIATEITCRITPLPEATKTMLAVYNSNEEAGQTVSDIIAAGILPATLEMMDNMIIRAVEASFHAGYPTDAAAVLIIEIDGLSEGLNETAEEIERICRRNGVSEVRTARDKEESDQLWAGRRGAFGAVARLFPNYSVSDGTVPRAKLPEVLRHISEIGRRYDLEIGNVFHAGDGNLHPLLLFDMQDKDQLERVHRAGAEILEACVAAGGTITGEHGVGTEKIKAMSLTFGVGEIDLMRRITTALDPAGLCNPGKILPEPSPAAEPSAGQGSEKDTPPFAAVNEFQGIPVYTPADEAELSAIVGNLRKEKKTFTPFGARTLFPFLSCKAEPDVFVQTTRMRSIVEHDAANLSVTAQAGIALGELQDRLAEAGQFLPLDAPRKATIGGIAAAALSGPRRHVYGATRDRVLGLKFVEPGGQVLAAGGKTVKNVAGYDFGKLLIGSWGKLGIITEITFHLLPLPKEYSAVVVAFDKKNHAYSAASAIIGSRLNPEVVTLMNPQAASRLAVEMENAIAPDCHALVLGAEGSPPAVERQIAELEGICKSYEADISDRMTGEEYDSLVAATTRLCYPLSESEQLLSLRICAPCKQEIEILEETGRLSAGFGMDSVGLGHLIGGMLSIHFMLKKDGSKVEAARTIIETLQGRFPGSNITVLGIHPDIAGHAPFISGNRTPSAWLRSIERCFDPDGVMSPGLPQW